MGFEGIAVAFAALLLLAYVVPHMHRRRVVLANTPMDERYAEELRMIDGTHLARVNSTTGDHGTIFTSKRRFAGQRNFMTEQDITERQMATNDSPTAQLKSAQQEPARREAQPVKGDLRSVARSRARARARISQRRAMRARGLVAGGVLGGIAVLTWIVVAATALPSWAGISATLLAGGYFVAFGFLANEWANGDRQDRVRIDRANAVLGGRNFTRRRTTQAGTARTSNARTGAAQVRSTKAPAIPAAKPAPVVAAASAPASATAPSASASVPFEAAPAKPVAAAPVRPIVASERPAVVEKTPEPKPVEPTAPSYTLKPRIQKRAVKPFEPAVQEAAEVPFRPTKPGERLGDVPLEPANPAPVTTGQEELRADVLAGGAALDQLLERRRA